MFPFEDRIAHFGFLLVRKNKTNNKRQNKSKWKPGLINIFSCITTRKKQNLIDYVSGVTDIDFRTLPS